MHVHSFWWGPNIGEFLFQGLKINGTGGLILLCIILACLSIFFEAIKVHQAKVRARTARERQRKASCIASETSTLLINENVIRKKSFIKITFNILIETIIFITNNIIGYILMLSVMVYNIYIFIAVIIGMGIGYFLFGHVSMKVNMENVQARTTSVICSPKCTDVNEPSTSGTTSTNKSNSYTINCISSTAMQRIQNNHNNNNNNNINDRIIDNDNNSINDDSCDSNSCVTGGVVDHINPSTSSSTIKLNC